MPQDARSLSKYKCHMHLSPKGNFRDARLDVQVTKDGLTSEEAAQRLEEYGPNKLAESNRIAILVYLGYVFTNKYSVRDK